LVVVVGYKPDFHTGSSLAFTTLFKPSGKSPGGAKYGKASLVSGRLKVSGGSVAIAFKCTGPKGASCKGTVTVTTSGKHGKRVSCANGGFSVSAGKKQTIHPQVGGTCLGLIEGARHHRHGATLKAVFTTHQGTLKRGVTLVG
jgi:hypothetical protein